MNAAPLLVAALLAATVPPTSVSLPPEESFPLTNATLRTDGATYTIEGCVRIPHNQTVTSLRQMTLVGKGSEAVLQVSGKLEIKAATGGRNTIRNVTIEVMPDCEDLLVTETTFTDGGGIRTSSEGPADCEIYLQNLSIRNTSTLSLKMLGGQIDLQDSNVSAPVRIQGVDRSERNRAKLKVIILNNKPVDLTLSGGTSTGDSGSRFVGLSGGLYLDNAWDALVRNNDLGGARTTIENCRKLNFDGNNVRSQLTELIQKSPRDFKKTKILSCDFRSKTTRVFAPGDPEKPKKLERMTIHTSWFRGVTDAKEIREKFILDGGREPGNGMLITFQKTSRRIRGLGGTAGE